MSIIKKFVNIFSKNKEILEEMKWSMSFEEKGILLSSNKDLNELEDIKDLLIMYETAGYARIRNLFAFLF